MPYLKIAYGDGRSFELPLTKDEITIGRSKDNDVFLTDNTVSRHHAGLSMMKEGFLLTDFGSFNGTKVNDNPVQSILLKDRDQIKIGRVKLTFYQEDKSESSLSDSVIILPDTKEEQSEQKIIKTNPDNSVHTDSRELLVSSTELRHGEREDLFSTDEPDHATQSDIQSLERMNKVLFVLYEISRELNSINDLHELLQRIMDLIFIIIDADYGFLVLTGGDKTDDLNPVVVKTKPGLERDRKGFRASRSIINKVISDKVALLTSDAMADSRFDLEKSVILQRIRSAMCVPLWKKGEIIGVIQLDCIRYDKQFNQDDLQLLQAIGSQMAMIIEQASLNEQIREEEKMRNRLERFHSPQVIEMILRGGQKTKDDIMEPKDLTATILFSDIIGFTRLSEKMPPREINMILNQYFSKMTDIVFSHDGTLDKYIGDALMAVFGAPMEKDDDPERAIRAALEMRQALETIKKKLGPGKTFNVRIGINTGRVVAGNIGSPKRLEYTVIGDPVNIASRLEAIAEPNQILIGEETHKYVQGKFKIREYGPRLFKGKTSEIMVYEVIGPQS
jgi:adenylate cyclase